MTRLNTDQSIGNDQYSKSITKSNNVLSNHWFDITNKPNSHKKPGDRNKDREQKDAVKKDEDVNLSFAQLEGKCYCCKRAGPKAPSCQDRNKPKEEWATNKAQQSHAQAQALHWTRIQLPLLIPATHRHHKLHSKQMSSKLDGLELISNYNFTKHLKCVTGYYWIINQVSLAFAIQKWLKTFECQTMEACTWPQLVDPWSLI